MGFRGSLLSRMGIDFIISTYTPKNQNTSDVRVKFEERFGYFICLQTIRNTIRGENLPVGKRGGKRYGMTNQEMKEAFDNSKGRPSLAVKRYGGTPAKYTNRWKKMRENGLI